MVTGKTHNTLGEYELLDVLGHGGMGVVYHARHRVTGEEVALKVVQRKYIATLRREAEIMGGLDHPGVLKVLDYQEGGDRAWAALELIRGAPLSLHVATCTRTCDDLDTWCTDTWLDATAAEPVVAEAATAAPLHRPEPTRAALTSASRRVLGWLVQVCEALAYVHAQGVVHLDVKPSNILIDERSGRVVLIDFGLARRLDPGGAPLKVSRSGTSAFLSPERLQGEATDARADLYAVGCMLYQITTGRLPFVGSKPLGVALQHITTPPTPPAALGVSLPLALEGHILALLAKRPDLRPACATLLIPTLQATCR